jgi:putative oxidoreductase
MDVNSQRDWFAPLLSSDAFMGSLMLAARLLMTGIFIYYIYNLMVRMQSPAALIWFIIAAQALGIVLIVLGYQTRFAALLLAACILASLWFRTGLDFHNFLVTISEKDLAIAGGFLFMFARGPGSLSVDGRLGAGSSRTGEENSMGPLLLTGRIFMVFVFLYFGVSKILHTAEVEAFMTRHNPHVPLNLVYLAILVQIIPPLMVLFGYKTRYGVVILAGFCIIAPSLFHSEFGNRSEVEHFFLDFAICGGFLFLFAQGPGPISVDAWRARSKNAAAEKQTLPVGA